MISDVKLIEQQWGAADAHLEELSAAIAEKRASSVQAQLEILANIVRPLWKIEQSLDEIRASRS